MVSTNTICKEILNVKNAVIEDCIFFNDADGVKHIRIKARPTKTHSDLSKTLEIAMNFESMTKDEDPEVIVSIIRSIVERIIVTQEGKDSNVHLFLKGQPGENYDDFFADSDTLTDAESRSDELCDLEGCRKLYSHLCGYPAARRMPSANAGASFPLREEL